MTSARTTVVLEPFFHSMFYSAHLTGLLGPEVPQFSSSCVVTRASHGITTPSPQLLELAHLHLIPSLALSFRARILRREPDRLDRLCATDERMIKRNVELSPKLDKLSRSRSKRGSLTSLTMYPTNPMTIKPVPTALQILMNSVLSAVCKMPISIRVRSSTVRGRESYVFGTC